MAINYFVIGLIDILLFVVSKRLRTVLIYIPLQIYFEGNGFWPDQLLAPLFLLVYWAFAQKKYFLLGVSAGLAILTKQTASYFLLGIGVIVINCRTPGRAMVRIVIGTAITVGIFLIVLVLQGTFWRFYQETLVYILTYHAGNVVETLWPTKYQVFIFMLVFGWAAVVGFSRKKFTLVLLMFLATLGVFTRFSYFHLQPAVPFAALLLADNLVLAFVPYLVFGVIFIKSIIRDWRQPPRFLGLKDFQNAREINTFVNPGERTLIVASQDHYYYLTRTLPAGNFFASSTPWNLNFPGIQERYISNLKRNRPKYVFLGDCMWEKGICYQPEKIKTIIEENYHQIATLPDGTGVYQFSH